MNNNTYLNVKSIISYQNWIAQQAGVRQRSEWGSGRKKGKEVGCESQSMIDVKFQGGKNWKRKYSYVELAAGGEAHVSKLWTRAQEQLTHELL